MTKEEELKLQEAYKLVLDDLTKKFLENFSRNLHNSLERAKNQEKGV